MKRCLWFKLMSVWLCLGIFLVSVQIIPVFSEQEEIVQQLRSASNGDALAEMMRNLTDDELQTLGIDLIDYNKLKYPKYACNALIEKEWTEALQFAQAFDEVMADMLYEETVSRTFSVFYREDGEADIGALPHGITFKTNQQINAARGKAVFGYEIENKNALVSGQIDLHLGAWTSSAGARNTYLQGYTMTASPFTGEDTAYYSQDTDEYKLWNTFMNQSGLWAGANLQFRYANAQENRNCIVDIPDGMLDAIKAGDASSLILYYGGGSNLYLDSVSSVLRLTYDKTVLLYAEDGGDDVAARLRACATAESLTTAITGLTAKEASSLQIDLDAYRTLAYPVYVGAALLKADWNTGETFKAAFENVMAEMLYEKTVSRTFSVFYREEGGSDENTLPLGITFKTNQQINAARGKAVFGYEIENKNALVSGRIDLHLGDWSNSNDTRSTYLQEYAMTASPFIGEDTAYYSQDTDEYKLWNTFMNQPDLWTDANLQFKYANVKTDRNCIVNIPAEMLSTIKAGDTSSLILYYGGGSNLYLDSVSSVLRLTYDKTILMEGVFDVINTMDENTDTEIVEKAIKDYAQMLCENEKIYNYFNGLGQDMKVQIFKTLARSKPYEDLAALQSGLTAAIAESVSPGMDYVIERIRFSNNDGDSETEPYGLVSTITLRKLTANTDDFIIAAAAYQNEMLCDIKIVDTGTQQDVYNALKLGGLGEQQQVFVDFKCQYKPDAVKVFVWDSVMQLHPMARMLQAENSKADAIAKPLKLWYDEPAPKGNDTLAEWSDAANLVNDGWEKWALPIGNSYMGAMVFGRTDTERIQITENSLSNPYRSDKTGGRGGLNNFAEVYIDFPHTSPENYSRELDIRTAVAGVTYTNEGIEYQREYFTSYPDKVLALRLTASQPGNISFTLHPEIPWIKDYGGVPGDGQGKSGQVTSDGDTITLSGQMDYYNIQYEGQLKVIPEGGTLTSSDGKITVSGADGALILMAVGTNYQMESRVFTTTPDANKLAPYPHPHEKVTQILENAARKTYLDLKEDHIADYSALFSRAELDLGGEFSETMTTDAILANYKAGAASPYLEELYFQYGRYLLIASSRKGAYPANLQGTWNRYDSTPWSAGYWHNINVQMNYWPAFNTNLAELFEPYIDYFKAYLPLAEEGATKYVQNHFPDKVDPINGNGWGIGTGGWLYKIDRPPTNSHSGPGTSALTSKLFYDYYEFTQDESMLSDVIYPAVGGVSRFLSKTVEEYDGVYLTENSASPEQRGGDGNYYITKGTAFDQEMIYENHKNVLTLASIMGIEDDLTDTIRDQIDKLDPVQVGKSGQVKEYREEEYYGEIGDPKHRHISQLVGLYPGTQISNNTPAWLDAAKVTLDNRGDDGTGWAVGHKMNLWARTGTGDRAYNLYKNLLQKYTYNNLWDTHPPFQIDGNLGAAAGVAEMLLQSHEGYISILPALPEEWTTGSFDGLTARGNFEVSAAWTNGNLQNVRIKSNSGKTLKVKFLKTDGITVMDSDSNNVSFSTEDTFITFETEPGQVYTITNIPACTKLPSPENLVAERDGGTVQLTWNDVQNAVGYNIYKAIESQPDYGLIGSSDTAIYKDSSQADSSPVQTTYKVVPVDESGLEGDGITVLVLPPE